jgi:hypothetical protein
MTCNKASAKGSRRASERRRTGLRNVLDVVTLENELILLVLRLGDLDTLKHVNVAHGLEYDS